MARKMSREKIRYAVVGAGWFGQAAILPAFANAKENSQLVAIVSGGEGKREELSRLYEVPAYPYEEYEKLLASGDVDAVYVATPNAMHREHTVAAARNGVHVLCEKPLADSAEAAEEMIDVCEREDVLLMTAYRLHFEKSNLTAVDLIKTGAIGNPRLVNATFTQQVDRGNTRLQAHLGGHPLNDIGVYCVNAARYLFRSEPTEVFAYACAGFDTRFKDVPEMVSAPMRFPGERIASFQCGFGEAKASVCQVIGTTGSIKLCSAFAHTGPRKLCFQTEQKSKEMNFPDCDQIAPEIVYFSNCIINDTEPEPNGQEGLIDLRIISALRSSIATGSRVTIPSIPIKERPAIKQLLEKPPSAGAELVHAAPPSGA